jgi:hypothetical protein
MGLTAAFIGLGLGEGVRRHTIAAKDEQEELRQSGVRNQRRMESDRKADLEALALIGSDVRRKAGRGPRRDPTALTGPLGVVGTGTPKTLLGL